MFLIKRGSVIKARNPQEQRRVWEALKYPSLRVVLLLNEHGLPRKPQKL
jgi:hypothetical protein